MKEMTGPKWAAMPDDVKGKMADCFVAYVRDTIDPKLLKKYDAAYRGETAISEEDSRAIVEQLGFPANHDGHVWTTAELDAKAKQLGWGSLEQVVEVYMSQGVLSGAARDMASQEIIRAPLPGTPDLWTRLKPYCPNDISLFKLYLLQPTS